jgi:site-specific DNA recombinase
VNFGTKSTPSLQESPRKRAANTRGQNTPALLKGLLVGPNGLAFTPAYTRRGKKLYRYYVSTGVTKRSPEACSVRRVPAAEVERTVVDQVRGLICTPEIVVRSWKEVREQDGSVTEGQVRTALAEFSRLWDELFPAEQRRIIQLLVEPPRFAPSCFHSASAGGHDRNLKADHWDRRHAKTNETHG